MLDELASTNELRVEQEELNAYIVEQAYRLGVQPDRLAKEIVDRGQLGLAMSEVLRGKALRLLTEQVKVTDEAGRPVDVKAAAAMGEDGDGDDAGETGDGRGDRRRRGERRGLARAPARAAGPGRGTVTALRRQRTGRHAGRLTFSPALRSLSAAR